MYTEMLAKDMVSDPERRGLYLETLGAEANRLSHLVENVLAYARLERGSTSGRREAVTLGALLDRALPRLRERAAHAGMAFEVDAEDRRGEAVRADPSAVEQILFNLVDNACKYGRCAGECSIRLEAAARENGHVALKVRDHGPGVPRGVRLFSPFSKSAEDAAVTAPGVGLGLALSRRLAREMGGDLKLESGPGEGACFVLELPAA
jgi:signal transduction histidine kinase